MNSIDYYDKNSEKYITDTMSASMEELLERFASYLPNNGLVLDLGCGSGRDSLWFLAQEYELLAIDGSKELVEHCQKLLGESVIHATFEDFETDKKFDGIWACASLLHVKLEDLPGMIVKYANYLKQKGVFFMSFKAGEVDYVKDGRWFTNFTEDKLLIMINDIENLEVVEVIKTHDVRKERQDEMWLSIIAKKR
ncbi:MAG TPA: SAM-dependent methyltransferase [Clostridiales bacterium]|jgi:2-polyprenyl-3-methyl-5-hydroxy-6-metoxy-1,4-benzoquinol methylase|nr:SAM-dependent methyltransferase [Clostridiales bacterium]